MKKGFAPSVWGKTLFMCETNTDFLNQKNVYL